jgi:hypothetical protein
MVSNFRVHVNKNYKKMERLAFLKERYKKLILEPRKEIESEIEKDLKEESIEDSNVKCFH